MILINKIDKKERSFVLSLVNNALIVLVLKKNGCMGPGGLVYFNLLKGGLTAIFFSTFFTQDVTLDFTHDPPSNIPVCLFTFLISLLVQSAPPPPPNGHGGFHRFLKFSRNLWPCIYVLANCYIRYNIGLYKILFY